jgi:hypothetical protein
MFSEPLERVWSPPSAQMEHHAIQVQDEAKIRMVSIRQIRELKKQRRKKAFLS